MPDKIQKKRRVLYDALVAANYDAGVDFNDFNNLMDTDEVARRWVYDTAKSEGWKVGDNFEQFVGYITPAQVDHEPHEFAQFKADMFPGGLEALDGRIADDTRRFTFAPMPTEDRKLDPMAANIKLSEGQKLQEGARRLASELYLRKNRDRYNIVNEPKSSLTTWEEAEPMGENGSNGYELEALPEEQANKFAKPEEQSELVERSMTDEEAMLRIAGMRQLGGALQRQEMKERAEREREQARYDALSAGEKLQYHWNEFKEGTEDLGTYSLQAVEGLGLGAVQLVAEAANVVGLEDTANGMHSFVREKLADNKESDGSFIATLGELAPNAIPVLTGLTVGALTKNPALGAKVATVLTGVQVAGGAGLSMHEAREYGATTGQLWATGLSNAATEYLTEKIPLGRYLGRAVSKTTGEAVEAAIERESRMLIPEVIKKMGKGKYKDLAIDVVAEGGTEAVAEVLQTATEMIYRKPEDYPTLNEYLNAAGGGFSGGSLLGFALGGVSHAYTRRMNDARRKKAGKVWLGRGTADGQSVAGEVLGKNEDGKYVILQGTAQIEVDAKDMRSITPIGYEEFKQAEKGYYSDAAYSEGYNSDLSVASLKNIYKGYSDADKALRETFEIPEGEDAFEWVNAADLNGFSDEQRAIAEEAILQDRRMEGAMKAYQDRSAKEQEEVNRFYDERTNNGNVYSYKNDAGEDVYITGGNVVLNSEGMVDAASSSEILYILQPDGKKEQISPENIAGKIDAVDVVQAKMAGAYGVSNKWNNLFNVVQSEFDTEEAVAEEQKKREAGVVFGMTDAEGEHRVEILNEGNGMADILFDGKEEQIPTEELNQWKQEAGIQSTENGEQSTDAADNGTPTESEANVAPTGDNVAPVAPVENDEPAPVELPEVPDFFRLGGKNYSVASRNADGSVDVIVDGKRETLPAGADYSTHMPTDKKGEVQYERMPVERTHEYFVQKVKDDEARAVMIEKRRKKAEAERKKFDKKPDPGIDPDAYEAKMTQWEADKKAAQAKVDYWNEVAKREAKMTRSRTREAVENIQPRDVAGKTADEFIAGLLGGEGIKITPESFRKETGAKGEQRQMVGVLSNDGVSIERASEIIWDGYGDELRSLGFGGDQTDIRDAIIDILSQGNPRGYAKRGFEARVQDDIEQQRADAEAWAKGTFGMTLEELYLYEETILPRIIREHEGFDVKEYYDNLAENYENDTTRESESIGRGGEILQGEQSVPASGTPAAGQRREGGAVSDDVQGGGQNGVAQEEVPVNEIVGNSEQLSSSEIPNNPTVAEGEGRTESGEVKTESALGETDAPGQSGVYSLSELTDNEGNRFYQKNGSINLWNLSPLFVQARRQNAPIRLTERNIDHILDEHKKELGDSEESVLKFLDNVFSTAKVLRKARSGGIFVVVENTKTDKAAIIRLYPSKYGDYYNVESAGYYRKNKWKDTENVIAELSEPTQSETASDVSKPQVPEEGGKELLNAETATTSASEGTTKSANSQENAQKSGESGDNSVPSQQTPVNNLNENNDGREENTATDNSGAQPGREELPDTEQVGAGVSVQDTARNSKSKRRNAGVGSSELGNGPQYDVNRNYTNEEIEEIVSSVTDIVDGKVVITGEVTDDIKAIVRGYESGGIAKKGRGILDEYYTDGKIVDAVNMLIAPYFSNSTPIRVLEPSVGIGNFIQAVNNIPTSEVVAFEINETTARIAKVLYPNVDVNLRSFETEFIDESGNKKPMPQKYSLVVGNPPYGSHRGLYKGLGEESKIARYEDYFVKRSLDVLDEGGVLAMVLPSSWMDRHTKFGGYTIERAYRLPSGAFEATQVGTDIVILKKDSSVPVTEHAPYFEQFPERVLGEVKQRKGRYGRLEEYVEGDIDAAIEAIKKENAEKVADLLDIEKNNDALNNIESAVDETGSPEKAVAIVKDAQESEKADKKPAKKPSGKQGKYKVELNRGVETVPTSAQFTHEFSEGEVEAFADTDYEGALSNPAKHRRYANYIGGQAIHDFYYAEGDIYSKLAQLEQEKDYIVENYGVEQYEKQKALLESVLPKQKSLEEITISPNTTFVKNLNILTEGGRVSLKDMFVDFLRKLPRQAFGESSPWEVIAYINNEQVHGTDKSRNQRIRERRKRVANDLFNKFLSEELSDNAKKQVVAAFNREYNSTYRPDYSKVPMFSTINRDFKGKPLKLTSVQLAGIGRMTVKGVGVLAHEVGFGKTLSGILAMHEAMTRGFAKKPVIVVPNDNILKQWVETIGEVLPNATVNTLGNLGAGYDLTDFKVNDGEFTIITYEGLKAMSFSDGTYNHLASKFSYITEDLNKHQSERDIQKRIEKKNELKGKMKRGTKSSYMFEDFGFDWLTVDEVHNANHIVSKVRLDKSVASDFRSQSQRTSDLGLKTWLAAQYIQEENNGRNVLLLSATPFTNKPLEYYSILSLVGNDMLERKGFFNVDQFFATFMEADNELEIGANGRPVQKTNVRRFRNNGLFQQLLSEFIDIKGEEDNPELVRPERLNKEYKIAQNELTAEAMAAAQELLGDNDTVLQGIGHARAAAFSPYATSLLGVQPKNHKEFVKNSPKIDATIKMVEQNIKDRPDAGQIIYSEVGVEYFPLIRDYLVKESGLKPSEVRIITGATSNSERVNIQTAFNNGEVKVVIGSPAIKEGLNLQGNTTDMYILSLPWNFTQLRQIEGRGWRQGNKWENIRINYMLTNDSVDVFMLQRLQLKQDLYNEAMKSGAESLDVSDIDTAELKTALITDPAVRAEIVTVQERAKLQQERTQIEADLSFVMRKYEAYNKLVEKLGSQKNTIKMYREWAKKGDEYWAQRIPREETQLANIENEIEEEKQSLLKKGVNVDDIVHQTEQAQNAIAAIQEKIDNLKELQEELTQKFREESEAKAKEQGDLVSTYIKERKAENKGGFYKIRPQETETKAAEENTEDDVAFRQGDGPLTDREVVMESDVYSKVLGKPRYYGQKQRNYVAHLRAKMAQKATELAEKLNTPIEVRETAEGLTGKKAKAKGWYDVKSGNIVVVVSNHGSIEDIQATVLHEVVAHKGLRQMFEEHFDAFLDNVYNNVDAEIRAEIDALTEKYGNTREATEEYLASLAENTYFEKVNPSLWSRIKQWFLNMLTEAGIKLDFELSDNELRYILWRSHQRLVNPGIYNPVTRITDVAVRARLGIGEYAPAVEEMSHVAEEDIAEYANENQDIFVSNAQRAVEGIQQNKATAEQWIAMLKKNGGLKAGEDAWLGLEEWLNERGKVKGENGKVEPITKQEILDYIGANKIQIEEVEYSENARFKGQSYYADRYNAGEADDVMPANDTRLNYTTEGLENKREIVLVVPTIESWNASDEIHFGDAGNGRAVAWVRFGETTDSEGNRVLVIDEIQSKRHQEGREKGYITEEMINAKREHDYLYKKLYRDGLSEEEHERYKWLGEFYKENFGIVPSAPFEKNWHELAMKRMLRLAAEEGFDKVAWTTGEQQAQRYNLSNSVSRIDVELDGRKTPENTNLYDVYTYDTQGDVIEAASGPMNEERLSEVFGKEIAISIAEGVRNSVNGKTSISGDGLRIGGEGMKSFYDRMLPSFVQKYTKKWGAKVGEVTMPSLEENNTMWSVDVTPEMQESVMQGQTMFRVINEQAEEFNKSHKGGARAVDIDPRNIDAELTEEGFSAEEIEKIKKRVKKGGQAFYDPERNLIYLFDPTLSGEDLESLLWHEDIHKAISDLDIDRELLDEFYELVSKDRRDFFETLAEREGYGKEECPEECVACCIQGLRTVGRWDARTLARITWASVEDAKRQIEIIQPLIDNVKYGQETGEGVQRGPIHDADVASKVHDAESATLEEGAEAGGTEEAAESGEARFRTVEETTEGSIDDVPAQPLTLMERITNSLLEVSAKNKENLGLRADALRAFGRDIDKVRSLMSAQREYDKSTVDALVKLAKMYFKNAQLLGEVTPYEMGRILSVINNVVGKRDIAPNAAKLMDIMLDAHGKALEGILDKAEKVKAKKVNAAGVEVMGGLDKYGQETIESYKAGKNRETKDLADSINESGNQIAKLEENVRKALGLKDGDDLEKAVDEYTGSEKAVDDYKTERARNEGLNLAMEYKEKVQLALNEIDNLKQELKSAERDLEGDARREAVKAIQDSIMKSRADLIDAYHSLIYKLSTGTSEAAKRAKEFRQAQIDRAREIQHNANSDLEGIPDDAQGVYPNKYNNAATRGLMSPMITFQGMLKKFGEKAVDGKGYLYNRFMPQLTNASHNEFVGKVNARVLINTELQRIFGKEMNIDGFNRLSREDGATISYMEAGRQKEFALNKGQMLYIYMANKMEDGRIKLRKMGITEELVNEIAGKLDPKMIQFADWVQGTLLKDLRSKYNAVHERMFGAPMAEIEEYFPLKIRKEAMGERVEAGQPGYEGKPSTVTGAIIKRTKNAIALDLSADAMSVLIEHIDDMEHWAAFAEFNRDINTLINYRHFQNQLKNMTSIRYGSGKEMWDNFKNVVDIATKTYRPSDKKVDKYVLNLMKGLTAKNITFKGYTALKQFLSAPGFWNEAGAKELYDAYTSPRESIKWALQNLPGVKERWEGRTVGNEKLLPNESDWNIWRNKFVAGATRWGMTPNAAIDLLTVATGARAVYMTKLKKYKNAGYSEQRAHEKALQDAAEAYNETQQSSEGAYLSPLQTDGTIASAIFSTYKNNSFGYTRKTAQAIANINKKREKGYKEKSIAFMTKQMMRDGLSEEQAKRFAVKMYNRSMYKDAADIALFGVGLGILWELGGAAIYLLGGNDEEEKEKLLSDALYEGGLSFFDGIPLGETLVGAGRAIKEGDGKYFKLPQLVGAGDIEQIAKTLEYEPVKGATDLLNTFIAAGIGVNPQTFTNMYAAFADGGPDDVGMSVLALLNAPNSQLEKLMVDKGMENYAANDLEEAKRYASYMLNRNTPITQLLYSDKAEQEVIEKYEARFNELLDERLENVVEDTATYNLFYENAKPEVKKELSKLRQKFLGKDKVEEFEKLDSQELVRRAMYGKEEINEVYYNLSTSEDEDTAYIIREKRSELGKIWAEWTKKKDLKYAEEHMGDFGLYKALGKIQYRINRVMDAMEKNPEKAVDYMQAIRQLRAKAIDLINEYSNE